MIRGLALVPGRAPHGRTAVLAIPRDRGALRPRLTCTDPVTGGPVARRPGSPAQPRSAGPDGSGSRPISPTPAVMDPC